MKMASFEKLKVRTKVKGSRSDVNLHYPQTATAGNTSGQGAAKYFFPVKGTPMLATSLVSTQVIWILMRCHNSVP